MPDETVALVDELVTVDELLIEKIQELEKLVVCLLIRYEFLHTLEESKLVSVAASRGRGERMRKLGHETRGWNWEVSSSHLGRCNFGALAGRTLLQPVALVRRA